MGLLLGDTAVRDDGSVFCGIWSVSILTRSDRTKDRVEISPEQLAVATADAEVLWHFAIPNDT